MRIIAMNTEAKLYEVFRSPKSDLVDTGYKKLGTKDMGTFEGQAVIETTRRSKGLKVEHDDPSIISKLFNISVRPEGDRKFDDTAIVNIAKDIDGTVSKLLSAGGVFTELFKELKNAKSKFILTVIIEDNTDLASMMALDSRRGFYQKQSAMRVGDKSSTKIISLPQIVIKASYDERGKPLLRPEQQKLVLIHELMHHFDLLFSSKSKNVKALVSALRANPIYTSSYSRTNDKEMIAEILAYYYLKSNYPEYNEQFAQLEKLAKSAGVKVSR